MFGKKNKSIESVGNLIAGLPVPENTPITFCLFPEAIKFQALTGTKKEHWPQYELSIDKVEKMQIFNHQQIQQVISQSTPGMILGAATFGILGAMIGGKVKTKEKINISQLLIIDYISDGKKQIVLNISQDLKGSQNVVEHFNRLKPSSPEPVQL